MIFLQFFINKLAGELIGWHVFKVLSKANLLSDEHNKHVPLLEHDWQLDDGQDEHAPNVELKKCPYNLHYKHVELFEHVLH